jgi:hypothetical protein
MGACLRSRLLGVAYRATHGFYSMAIHGVSFFRILFIFIMHFVMTETTGYKGIATRGQQSSFAFVMLTTTSHFAVSFADGISAATGHHIKLIYKDSNNNLLYIPCEFKLFFEPCLKN